MRKLNSKNIKNETKRLEKIKQKRYSLIDAHTHAQVRTHTYANKRTRTHIHMHIHANTKLCSPELRNALSLSEADRARVLAITLASRDPYKPRYCQIRLK